MKLLQTTELRKRTIRGRRHRPAVPTSVIEQRLPLSCESGYRCHFLLNTWALNHE